MNLQREKLAVAGFALFLGLLFAVPAQGQELGKAASSLELVPADAATYTVMLRNREQIEAIAKSKAWARLTSLGFVKMLQQKFDEEWSREGGQLAPVREWYEKADGKQ